MMETNGNKYVDSRLWALQEQNLASAVGCKRGYDSNTQQSSLPGTADGREGITELTGEVSMEGAPRLGLKNKHDFSR